MSLCYSNPPGGRPSIFTMLCESVDPVTQLNCFDFSGFAANFLCISPPPKKKKLTHFLDVIFFFNMIWLFLWNKCVQCQALKWRETLIFSSCFPLDLVKILPMTFWGTICLRSFYEVKKSISKFSENIFIY